MPRRLLRIVSQRVRALWRKGAMDAELSRELAFHLEQLTAENVSAGMPPREARLAARRTLGNVPSLEEQCRDHRRVTWLHDGWQDLRHAYREFGREKRLAFVLVLTIAAGVGANTAIFSVIDGFRRPLPVSDPDRLVVVAAQKQGDDRDYKFSYTELEDFRRSVSQFSDLFAFSLQITGITTSGTPSSFLYSAVSGNYFTGLGVEPILGRLFRPGEGERPGEAPVVVLGHAFWQSRFGGDPRVIGSKVRIGGSSAEVIGVVPREFRGTFAAIEMDGYLPLNALHGDETRERIFSDRTARWLTVLGRMRPGVGLDEAQAATALAARQMERQHPDASAGIGVRVIPEPRARPEPAGLAGDVERSDRPAEVLLLSLAALVLLLACVNVANLLFVRATARHRELAVRAAVGASRGRLVRQALAETAALALLGAAAGLLLGILASRALERAITLPASFPVSLDFGLHWRVFAYTFIAATVTVVLCGVWPARRASRAHAGAALHDGGRQTSGGPAHQRLRSLLVAGQIAGSFVLLIVAALFVRDLRRTAELDLGFEPDGLLNVWMDPQWAGYDEPRTEHFYEDLERRVRALPGVESVSLAFSMPIGYYRHSNDIHVEGHALPPGEQPPGVSRNYVGVSYFATMKMPIVRGRAFTAADDERAPAVAIVNETMAGRFWPNQDAVGRRFRGDGPESPWIEIVGVARDSKYVTLWEDPQPYFYKPLAQQYSSMRWLHVRSALAPERLRASIEEEIRAVGPDVPTDVQTMEQVLSGYGGFMIMRIAVMQAGAMGLLGLFLAVVGIYGVISYGAVRRTKEIGVRVALGATPADVLRLVIGQGAFLIAGGLIVGFGAAVGVSRMLAGIVGMADATDPWVFTLVTLLLAGTALVASYLPARHALRVPPTVALRQE